MTWTEFKALVDKAIAEQGATGDVKIFYIDTHMPEKEGPFKPNVVVSDYMGLSVG